MALSNTTLVFATAAPAGAAGAAFTPQPPDNCHTVIFHVPTGTANPAFVGIGAVGLLLVEGTNAAGIEVPGSLTWSWGVLGVRQNHDAAENPSQALLAGGNGGASVVHATYICSMGDSGLP